ncbi:MAG: L-lactate permease, partial [Verrucomicrobiota bacterium]
WVVWAFAGFRGMMGVWPAALVAGVTFAIPQFLVSNFHGPWLVDIVASLVSIVCVVLLLRVWKPSDNWQPSNLVEANHAEKQPVYSTAQIQRAWTPWLLLSAFVFLWGLPQFKKALNAVSAPQFQVPRLHNVVVRTHPVVPKPTPDNPTKPEAAVFSLNWLTATGTGILASALVAGFLMGFTVVELAKAYWQTLIRVRFSLLTIAAMLALGYVTKYSGTDATLGLALAKTGALYPFFGTLLGWLGVALTGSDTASNVLFGGLQKITAEQTGISPVLMGAANSSGGVMGKMVDAQSIVVASTATNWYGHEGAILRYVFFHSIALACLVGILVYLQAYVPPFKAMVP